jgi:Tol biopolymer transport system component
VKNATIALAARRYGRRNIDPKEGFCMARKLAMAAALAALAAPGAAHAAGPGETFPVGGLPLPAGAIAGGHGGYSDDEPTAVGMSEDGRYVAFAADADALSPDANPDVTNIFRKDRLTGDVVLVGRATGAGGAVPDHHGFNPKISDDGDRVAWVTRAALDPADTDDRNDVYVRDIGSAATFLATPGTDDSTSNYDLSGDGTYVAFETATALAAAFDTNGVDDIYRRAVGGASNLLVSRAAGLVSAADAASTDPSISDDGGWVAFTSRADDLVAGFGDGGALTDVFARDIGAATNHLISNQAGAPLNGANGSSDHPEVAGTTGTAVYVAYDSEATDVAGVGVDTSTDRSVYRRRLSLNSSVLISRADGGAGVSADSRAHVGGISDSGARVVFASDADNLGPGDHYYGAYLRDTGAGTTALVSEDNEYAVEPAISDDGGVAAWVDGSGGFTPDSDPDLAGVFARVIGGAPEYVSRPPGSAPFLAPATEVETYGPGARTISADGRYVVFTGYSTHLAGNENGPQIYRRDTLTGAIELVSRAGDGTPADQSSYEPSISADGMRVAFASQGRLDPADTDDAAAIYVRDLAAGTTTLASRADGAAGAPADASAWQPGISADGRHVTFTTTAANLGAGDGNYHVYLRDLAGGRTQSIDRATGPAGVVGNDDAELASPSGDGRLVVFTTRANNLDPADPGPSTLRDVYVRDTVAQTTTLVSRRSGLDGAKAATSTDSGVISADGRFVAFETGDDTLAPEGGPWGGTEQVVARDLASGQNTLVSRAPGGAVADAAAGDPSIDGDGSVVAFASAATNLLDGVGGGNRHGVFARTMATGALSGPPAFGIVVDGSQTRATVPSLSDDGHCMAFRARGHNAISGAAGDFTTAYVYAVGSECPTPASAGGAPTPAGPSKPVISDASMKRKTFRVGKKKTAKRAQIARRRTPAGSAFRFTLSTDAELAIVLKQQKSGRRSGGKCRKPTPKLRKRRACTRYVKRGKLVRTGLTAKRHKIAFSGRVGRKALSPGRYKATLRARNAAGSSKPVHLKFRIVRR